MTIESYVKKKSCETVTIWVWTKRWPYVKSRKLNVNPIYNQMNMKIIVFVSTGIHPSLNLYSIICEPSSCNVETLTMERFLLSSISNRYHSSCACLLHPKSRNQGKGMLEVPWLAVELREWFASHRLTFPCSSIISLPFLYAHLY